MNKVLLENKKDNLLDVITSIKYIANKEVDMITQNTLFQLATNLRATYESMEELELEVYKLEKEIEQKKPIKKIGIVSK